MCTIEPLNLLYYLVKSEGLTAWARRPSTLHLKLYSVFIAVFGRWSGFNILTIEPLNLLYYLVKSEGLTAWARRPSTLHLKLYSVFILALVHI